LFLTHLFLLLSKITYSQEVINKPVADSYHAYETPHHYIDTGYSYLEIHKLDSAEIYLKKALALIEERHGKYSKEYCDYFPMLIELYDLSYNYEKLIDSYLNYLDVIEKVLGQEAPEYSRNMNVLGDLYMQLEQYELAETYLAQALVLHENNLGKDNIDYIDIYNNLGLLYYHVEYYKISQSIFEDIKNIFENQEEIDSLSYVAVLMRLGEVSLSLGNYEESEKYMLYGKQILESSNNTNSLIYINTLTKLGKMNIVKNNYSESETYLLNARDLYLKLGGDIKSANYSDIIADLATVYNATENYKKTEQYSLEEVQILEENNLEANHPDYALTLENLGALSNSDTSSDCRDLKSDFDIEWKDIRNNLLNNEIAIDFINYQEYNKEWSDTTLYAALIIRKDSEAPVYVTLFEQSQLSELLNDDFHITANRINKLYNGSNPRFFNGQKLYELIWKPLEQHLEGIKTVYYSPAGLLNRISFSALPVNSLCLTDKYNLHLVSSTQEVVKKGKEQSVILSPVKYIGAEANEESLKNLSGNSPELLQIATHCFFLEDEKTTERNPLLRAGLLFAGANRALTDQDVVSGIEDGILTAEEISRLDLSKTKLVVLSACETGLGEVNNSEGVFGLQRAFKLAGVETLVMSLWKVDDKIISQFMLAFYENLYLGKSKLESFRTAQNIIRQQNQNPYYWAGFVMMD